MRSVLRRLAAITSGLLVHLPLAAYAGQVPLDLVSARDHIEGSMTTAESVYADATRIYLATAQGTLFVLARDRAANFPLVESITYTSSLRAVRGDDQNVYVTAGDGNLLVYQKGSQLALAQTIPIATYSLAGLAVTADKLFVGVGQTHFAINDGFVYLAGLNAGDDIVIELSKPLLTPVRTYGLAVAPGTTVVYDRQTGNGVGTINSGGWNLYADNTSVIGTVPGCCGSGIGVYDPNSLALSQYIWRTWTNTVATRSNLMIAGSEAGYVDIFDLAANPSPMLATLDLRQITGHTLPDDIEIRALWADGLDNLIFAGSSWGNDQTRTPSLPSFFVLESAPTPPIDRTPPTVTVLRPNAAGERLFTGTPFVIEWTAADNDQIASIDVLASIDGGSNYDPVPGCTGLSGATRRCTWMSPGPITSRARIALVVTDASGNVGSDISDADASILSGAAVISVSQPNTALTWAIGTTQQIKWTHNLGANSWVSVELSRDDGATWTAIAATVQNATASSGVVTWTVTSPATTRGRVRVSALNAPIADVGDVAFTIATPVITVTQPNTNVPWVIGSTQTIRWTHNLGLNTPMEIALSRNAGATWTTLAASVPNSGSTTGSYTWVVTGGATTQARIRVTWRPAVGPAVKDVSDVNFRIVNP